MTENISPKSPKRKWNMGKLQKRERLNTKEIARLPPDIAPQQDNWSLELKEEEINYDSLIDILKEISSERTLRQKKIISKFLENTNLYSLIQSFNLDPEVLQELMITLCSGVKYEHFKQGENVFKIGEQADKFYIVLKGEVKVLKPKRKIVEMTKKDYVLLLKKIKDSKDFYLLKKTIQANKETIGINEYEIPRLLEKISRIHLIKLDLERKKYFMIRLEGNYTKPFENFLEEIDAGLIASNCNSEDIKLKLYDLSGITESDKEEDAIIFDEEKYSVRIFDYEENGIFTEGNYFGENGNVAIDRKRTQFIYANVDTECMSISNDIYQKNILAEFQKLKNKEISFLNENCIFRNIGKGTFLNHYFKYFQVEEYWRGENIFIEMQNLEKVYFIKEGRIELNLFTNVLKMHNYARELMSINSEIINHFKDEEKLPMLNFQPKNYMENLKKKKFVSLFLFQDNEMLGIEEACFNFKRLYRATVLTDKAYLYSIPINKFRKIVEFEPKMHFDLKNYSFVKICNLIKRLSNIKNDTLRFIDGNYKEDNCKKNQNNENANKEKNEKKASSEINIINQVNLDKKQSKNDLNSISARKSNKDFNRKNKKVKVPKLKKSNGSIVDELARYYQDYQDWNKQLNKKWDLMLNPPTDEYLFYKQINYELNTIKELKSDIDKLRNDSIVNILPKINSRNKDVFNYNTPAKQSENTSNYENFVMNRNSREKNSKNKKTSNDENSQEKNNHSLNTNSKSNKIIEEQSNEKNNQTGKRNKIRDTSNNSNNRKISNEKKLNKKLTLSQNLKTNKFNREEMGNCESSDDSLPRTSKKETEIKPSNRYSINGTKFYKSAKISSKNINIIMEENLTNKNDTKLENNNNKTITIKINPDAYAAKFTSSLLNKNKKINNSHSNLFMTNLNLKNEQNPLFNEKNSASDHQLNLSIEAINYNHCNISSRSFKDVEVRENVNGEKKSNMQKDKNLLKSTKEKSYDSNTKNITKFNSIDEESIKGTENAENINSDKKEDLENKKDINLNFFGIRINQSTEESSENNKINQDVFGSTKLILSQRLNLKANKLKRLHKEYMPRYFSNKFCSNVKLDELGEFDVNTNNEIKKEEIKSPMKDCKKQITDDPIELFMLKKSSNFVPFSVDNSINGIKKLNKRIQMLAPKKKYNFIINNY